MIFLTASATPEPVPTSSAEAQELIDGWISNLEGGALAMLVVTVLLLLAWFVGRGLIKGVTKGIERGTPFQDARTRRALKKARIPMPEPDTMELRLETERRSQRAHTLKRVMTSALAVVLIATFVMTLLTVLGIPVSGMLASAGIVGVALGFGAQSLVKDVLTGVFMLIEDQYGVGDVVDLGEASGAVEEVGIRSTRLRSLDGTVWYIPNGEITRVGNMTRLWSRALVEARFAYDTDIEAARQAMLDAVEAAKGASDQVAANVLSEPEVAGVESLEYNAVMLRLLVQVNPSTQWDIMREIRRQLRTILAERGIELAVPGEAMMVDSKAPSRVLHDSARTDSGDQPTDADGRPLPPPNDAADD
ncbi:mechanosensitive ion channel family protein [Demequina lignilytica]|uniref:Mechanosensitive ion channel family protein n=1 Tax=Demequina lignilytica TaxID=3051663 RepID=A0AB35MH40_9MICO|nr:MULTISPECIES: mechanosensitive ion channel family protein [unclassified Demequina]MDN4483098.1 mechanosensitive ion channel family protein [Demequina sp. SYSU T0a273]MDN4490946.1 mechanosensitive ion channel family protein [Demequina sp. SYSU T00068]